MHHRNSYSGAVTTVLSLQKPNNEKMMLNSEINGKATTFNDNEIKPGDNGITLGRLAPGGKIKINGITVSARSTGSYIDPNTEIEVVKIEGNIVIVKPIN
jgi:membrane-bound ClpP family serine protease